MSSPSPNTPNRQAAPRPTESAWTWLLFFALAAVLGLFAIAPKYRQRQERLERAYKARQQAAYGTPARPSQAPPENKQAAPPSAIVPWQTLAVLLGLLLCILAAGWLRSRQGPRCSPSHRQEDPT